MGFRDVAKQLLARGGRAALVPVLLALLGGFWLLSPAGAAPSDITSVAVTPESATNAVNTVHTMTATVSPAEAGAVVRFRVFSGPNATDDGVGVTNGSGQTALSYLGSGGVGTDTILVWVDVDNDGNTDGGEPLAIATATWTSGLATSLALTPEADTNSVDTQHTVTATLSPAGSGLIVRFKVATGPNTGKTGVALTDASGEADYTYLGNGGAGVDTIVAWADLDNDAQIDNGEATDTATKLWTDSEVDSIALSPVSDTNPINTNHTVTATLSPVQAGVLIRFRVSSGPNSGDGGLDTTDAAGKATFTYTGDGGVGGDVILAWVDLDTDGVVDAEEPATVAAKYWVTEAVSGIALSPTTDSNQVGTQHTLTATVLPVQSGVVVRFDVSSGPNADEMGSAPTNAQGKATFSYSGNSGVGTDLIIAWADLDNDGNVDSGEPQATALKQWTTVAIIGLTLAPATDDNAVGTLHHLTATVNPKVTGRLVRMEVVAGPNTGDTDSDQTNSSGEAQLSYRGDGGVGTDLILAWVDLDNDGNVDSGEPQATALKQWTTVTIAALTLTPATDDNAVGTLHHLTATVNPKVTGRLVRMEVVAGPNTGDTDSDQTNNSGEAQFSYRGDGGVGTDLILAWVDLDGDGVVDSGEQQATATKVWTTGGPGAILPGDVGEVCAQLDGGSHPSLQALCDVLATGAVSDHAREVIEGIILRNAGWMFPGWNGHCRDRDEGRGRGHDHHDDDERCGEGFDDDDRWGWSLKHDEDDDD